MLSAFGAQPLVELRLRDKSKIECLLAFGDRLLVGLNTGALRIYRVNEPPPPELEAESASTDVQGNGDDRPATPTKKHKPVDLMREEEKFSKRPILQLAIVKEASTLVSLSDNFVTLSDFQTYIFQERLEKSKGASLFAITSNIFRDESSGGIPSIVSRLAVAVKRRIVLFTWRDMEFAGGEAAEEVTLVSAIKSLTWASGTKIIAGLDSGFVLIDVETMQINDITKSGYLDETGGAGTKFGAVSSTGMGYMGMGSWVPKPMATKLVEGEMLLAKDVNTLFINTEGKPLLKRQVPWPAAPEAIGYSYPYLLALQPSNKGVLEIRNPETLSLVQSIPLAGASILHVPNPNISLAHAGRGFLVGSERVLWRMTAVDYDSQIEELVSQAAYDEAISLIELLEDTLLADKDQKLRSVKILKAQTLFDQKKYRESMELFAEASTPPERVVRLYPRIIAGDLSTVDGEDEHASQSHVKHAASPPSSPQTSPSRGGVLSRFRAEPKKVDAETASIKSSTTDADSARGMSRARSNTVEKLFQGKELLIATNELVAFLAQTRVRLPRYLHKDGSLREPLPENLASDYRPEWANLVALEEDDDEQSIDWHLKLLEVATLVYTTLFRAYMVVNPRLAGSLFRIDNFCDPAVVREKLSETGRFAELVDFLHGKKLHREALELLEKFGKPTEVNNDVAEVLRGPRRTVAYLQHLSPEHVDLILEFAAWPLQQEQDLGMEIFLADTENAETLPRWKVLDFLQRASSKLAIRYLEHIIGEWNDMTPEFHQKLIDLYLEKLRAGRNATKAEDGAFKDDTEKNEHLHKVEAFLGSSSQYQQAKVFQLLPADDPDLYESRAIVLSKMGQHKQALQIYVFQLHNHEKAEDYCNEIFLANQDPNQTLPGVATPGSDAPSIYHILLALYLNPPPPHGPQLEPALSLLSNHGARLPASQTLALIPADLHVKILESYFTGRMRAATSAMNEERLVAALRGVQAQEAEVKLTLDEKAKSAVIGEDSLCGVCMRRFTAGSAVKIFPDGRAVHYGCFSRMAKAAATFKPTTAGRF